MYSGQLHESERRVLAQALRAEPNPQLLLEVGTAHGRGSTHVTLEALRANGSGHLWGIEASESTFKEMQRYLRAEFGEFTDVFTPIFGFSQSEIPNVLGKLSSGAALDYVFLDGGNNPQEQVDEFLLLADRIALGGVIFSHDAKLRKGRWLVPYLRSLDNWRCTLHDGTAEGLFEARKIATQPSHGSSELAERRLRALRSAPIERLARSLPSGLKKRIFALMPAWLAGKIADGR